MHRQAAAKLKEMEDSMLKYYMANADKAGIGLECLPGVKQLLQELKVRQCCSLSACFTMPQSGDGKCLQQLVLAWPSSIGSDKVCSPITNASS